jgi:hypothetical protein
MRPLASIDRGVRIILKWTLKTLDLEVVNWTELTWDLVKWYYPSLVFLFIW